MQEFIDEVRKQLDIRLVREREKLETDGAGAYERIMGSIQAFKEAGEVLDATVALFAAPESTPDHLVDRSPVLARPTVRGYARMSGRHS